MKITRNILIALAGGLTLSTAAPADEAGLPGNPYALVVARNIFGLNPPAPVDPNAAADATPPPKITPNGIMSIFGQLQVLFKVAGTAKPGKPAVDDSYILSEGQRQDDIEVVKIDEPAGLVTFNNHGETQQLALVAATASPTPAPGGGPGVPGNPVPGGFRPAPGGLLRPGGTAFNGGGTAVGSFGGGNRGMGNNGMNGAGYGGGGGGNNSGGQGGGLNFGNPSSLNNYNAASQIPLGMTPEDQTIIIEANRELTRQQVINGELPPLPPTELTPSDAVGPGGNPLISSPNSPPK